MVGRLFIAEPVLALIPRAGGANVDPQPEPTLVPPWRALVAGLRNIPRQAPTTMASIYRHHRRVDCGNDTGQGDLHPEEGSRGP